MLSPSALGSIFLDQDVCSRTESVSSTSSVLPHDDDRELLSYLNLLRQVTGDRLGWLLVPGCYPQLLRGLRSHGLSSDTDLAWSEYHCRTSAAGSYHPWHIGGYLRQTL